MAITSFDTFAYPALIGVDLLDRAGQVGAAYSAHPASGTGTWLLTGAGRAYSTVAGYSTGHYLLSGVPGGIEYDVVVSWRFLTQLGDAYHGISFRYDPSIDSGYRLLYESYTGFRRWHLQKVIAGVATTLGSTYADDVTDGDDRLVRVELRTTGIAVLIDGVSRITSADTTYTAAGRVGLFATGTPGAGATTGMHLDWIAVTSAGAALPEYVLSGPASGPPLAPRVFTVALADGVDPGSVTVTPSATLAGTFDPTAVTLTDGARTGTFAFTPAGVAEGTIGATDDGWMVDPPAMDFACGYFPPWRLSAWESHLVDRHHTSPTESYRYLVDMEPLTWPDGTEHYDVEGCWLAARDYSVAHLLHDSDFFDDEIDAAEVRYRDRSVLASKALDDHLQAHHVNTIGLTRHYMETADPLGLEAVDWLLDPVIDPRPGGLAASVQHEVGTREHGFLLSAALDRDRLGLDVYEGTDIVADAILGHIATWLLPPEERLWAVSRPWMVGIAVRALIAYRELYTGDPARAARCASIPAAVEACCEYVWESCWIPAGTDADGWDRGAIKYQSHAFDDPLFDPIEGLTVQAVLSMVINGLKTFTGPMSLSAVDGYYTGATFAFDDPGDGDLGSVMAYEGSTRTFTLSPFWGPIAMTAGQGFSLYYPITDGDGGSPTLNHLFAPAFAWCYLYRREELGDMAGAVVHRDRFDAFFDGGYQCWVVSDTQKVWNQSLFWITEGLAWRAAADAYPVLNVRDFGATGDGTTDDSAAIQAAIDANGGGTIFIPAGDYRIGDTIVISVAGTTLKGEGPESILRLLDDCTRSAIGVPSSYLGAYDPAVLVGGITLSDLTLDGNRNGFGGEEGDYFAVFSRQSQDFTIARVTIRNWVSDGISISNGSRPAQGLVIEDCRITARRSGIHIGFLDGGVIRRNLIIDTPDQWWGPSAANGIDVEVEGYDMFGPEPHLPFVRDLAIEDNVIIRTGTTTSGDGVALQPAYGPISGIAIRRNFISGHQLAVETTGALGIYDEVAGVRDVTIADNWLTADAEYEVAGYSMSLGGCADVTVSGNVVNDLSGGNFSGYNIGVTGSLRIAIDGNTLHLMYTTPTAIAHIYGGNDTVAVTNNYFRTQDDMEVVNDGTNSNVTVSGNISLAGDPWDQTPPAAPSFDVAEGTFISSPTVITVAATDAGSGIARVYFFVDGVPAGHSDAAPHAFTFYPFDHVDGDHILSAFAVDGSANMGETASVTVMVGDEIVTEYTATASVSFSLTVSASYREATAVKPPGGYAGRYQVGREVPLQVQCHDTDGAPAVPDSSPVARVYRDGVAVRSVRLPADDDPEATGRFRGRLVLDGADAPGRYAVVYLYVVGGEVVVGSDTFEVDGGGDAHGPVLACSVLARPDGDAVLAHLGSGRLASGRTPYLDEGV